MAQEPSNDVSWAFFPLLLPPHPLSFRLPVISCRIVVALSFHLAWWRRCHRLAILKWHPFPHREQWLTVVVLGVVVVAIGCRRR